MIILAFSAVESGQAGTKRELSTQKERAARGSSDLTYEKREKREGGKGRLPGRSFLTKTRRGEVIDISGAGQE